MFFKKSLVLSLVLCLLSSFGVDYSLAETSPEAQEARLTALEQRVQKLENIFYVNPGNINEIKEYFDSKNITFGYETDWSPEKKYEAFLMVKNCFSYIETTYPQKTLQVKRVGFWWVKNPSYVSSDGTKLIVAIHNGVVPSASKCAEEIILHLLK